MQTKNANNERQFIYPYGPKITYNCDTGSEGGAKQSFKDECDINNILKTYIKTGTLDFAAKYEGQAQYGDVTAIDFQNAQFLIADARGMFAAMPSALRSRFDNDPAKFLAFVNDDRNRNEAEDLGLLKAKEPATTPAVPAPAPVVAAPAATATPQPLHNAPHQRPHNGPKGPFSFKARRSEQSPT